jgi:trimethylamine--corrinoid protein Co-methyltransferase
MGGCDHVEGARQVWDLVTFIAGSEEAFRKRPFVSVITNPISPLTIETKTLEILEFCCGQGIPATCAPAPIAGATSPATLAGTLVQTHAEALAGVAVTQVFSPGAPVMYGAVPTAMDLRSMDFTMGSVEMAMMNSMAPRLAKLYELPIYGTAGITESKRPEIQAGLEKAFSIITVAMARADLIHLAAGMLDSGNSISYEQFVIDNEIIGMARRLIRGMDMSEEALAHEVISKVGPGGNYVVEDHTVEHMMDEFFYPELAIRKNFDIWEEQDKLTMLKKANQRVEIILRNSVDGLMDPDTIIKIKEEFIGLSRI